MAVIYKYGTAEGDFLFGEPVLAREKKPTPSLKSGKYLLSDLAGLFGEQHTLIPHPTPAPSPAYKIMYLSSRGSFIAAQPRIMNHLFVNRPSA
ncbi:hypothetical protein EYF80_014618 [Liparis tanakae]|uniref:Uncharacterized protein n=1 Tax=Liparis tanakae TaxID=230148 RepID=A0A4Z2IB18_9TELE|nr:hypothetical protein EYF80_014618 [Liparis tanakae]